MMTTEVWKGKDRCIGYDDITNGIAITNDGDNASNGIVDDTQKNNTDVDTMLLWHLRSLAIQPGGLSNSSHGRKLGWIKLAGGVDNNDELSIRNDPLVNNVPIMGALDDASTYVEIQKILEHEMGDESKWQIFEREQRGHNSGAHHPSSTMMMSHASSLSTDATSESDPCHPLADDANLSLQQNPDTPISNASQLGCEPNNCKEGPPPSTSFDSNSDDYGSSASFHNDSPPSLSSPSTDVLRHQEQKLLIQIAASAFYLLQCEREDQQGSGESHSVLQVKFQLSHSGLQDLIAVLLIHLESPSLTSRLLKQIVKSHYLGEYYYVTNTTNGSEKSFASCINDKSSSANNDHAKENDNPSNNKAGHQDWDILSLAFFPLLQVVDNELHSSLQIDDEHLFLHDRVLVFGKVLRKWISCWFCSHDALSLEVVARIVDLFLASHESMPLYLSTAILCHPSHREKLLDFFCQLHESSSGSQLADMLGSLLSSLPINLVAGDSTESDVNDLLIDFMEQSISTAISYMEKVPPRDLISLVKEYQSGILVSYLSPVGIERAASNWTMRSKALTDYNSIRQIFTKTKNEPAYQMALIASGLTMGDSCTQDDWSTLRHQEMTPRKAFVLGMALCASAKLLQLQQSPACSEMTGSFSRDISNSIGAALFVGLQSLMALPLTNNFKLPQVLAEEIPIVSTVGSLGKLPPVSNTINAEVLQTDFVLDSSTKVDAASLLLSVDSTASVPQCTEGDEICGSSLNTNGAGSHDPDTSLFTLRDIEGDVISHNEMPPKSVSLGPYAEAPYEIRDDLGDIIDKLQDLLLETLSATETRDYMPAQPDQENENRAVPGPEEHRHLLDTTAKKEEPKAPAVSITNRVKSYSRKLGTGIKKHALGGLKGFKKDYIALVESNDILL